MNTLRTLAGATVAILLALLLWAAPASSNTPPQTEGDVNCDKVTNSIDAALILQVDAGLIDTVSCAGVADLNLDGTINSLDAAIVLQITAGLCCPILDIEVTIESPPDGVPFGEPVVFAISITNPGDRPVTRRYNNGQLFDFSVSDFFSRPLWHWSQGKAFTEAIEYRTFEPGETTIYRVEWNQQDDSGEPVLFGLFNIIGTDVGCSTLPPRSCRLGAIGQVWILPPRDRCSGDWLIPELNLPNDRLVVSVGETVPLSVTVTNCSDQPITRSYGSNSHRYDFYVLDEDHRHLWKRSFNLPFPGFSSERVFQPGETLTYSVNWNQQMNDGEFIGPGVYELRAVIGGCNKPPPLTQCSVATRAVLEIVP